MRAIIQRVTSASVTVDNQVISEISKGLMVLIGLGVDDKPNDLEQIARKLLSLRVFSESSTGAPWKLSVKDIDGELLCVSQFTLYANLKKGNKPDFHSAMNPSESEGLYTSFLEKLGQLYDPRKIKDGRFGAMMSVNLTNDGPVTFTLDSEGSQASSRLATGKDQTSANRQRQKQERRALWESKKEQSPGPSEPLEQAIPSADSI